MRFMNDGVMLGIQYPDELMLIVRGLRCRTDDVHLEEIDLSLKRGELFGVLGPPGAGKRLLLQVLAGKIEPASGEITLVDSRADGRPSDRVRGWRVGHVPHRRRVEVDRTARELLAQELSEHGVMEENISAGVEYALDTCRLGQQADRTPRMMTSSMRRRLDLALALAHNPNLLIIEELLYGIEEILVEPLWNLLRDLTAAGRTIVVGTSDYQQADRFDRILLLDRGRARAIGAPDVIRQQVFGGDLVCVRIPDLDRKLMNRLLSLPYVKNAIRLDTNRVEVLLVDYRHDRRRLESVLRRAGYRSVSFRRCKMPVDRIHRVLAT